MNAPTVARVVLERAAPLLDYAIPESMRQHLVVGSAVRVPLRQRVLTGYVTALAPEPDQPELQLKDIVELDPQRPPLPTGLLELVLFAARYYGVTPGEALAAALPPFARTPQGRYVLTAAGAAVVSEHPVLGVAARFPKGFAAVTLERRLGLSRRVVQTKLRELVQRGWLQLGRRRQGPRRVQHFARAPQGAAQALSPALTEVWHLLGEAPKTVADLAQRCKNPRAKLTKLVQMGLVVAHEEAQRVAPYAAVGPVPTERLEPTAEQAHVIAALTASLDAARFAPFLLHGVTGSGKTEVYLRAIEHALARGKTALVLVPEIALTPQLGERFRQRFGGVVATFHSGLTPAERRDEWERVASGEARIGLGARSALFLPLANLGIIVVDEEHESSFKQEESPRYHARDLAVVRAQMSEATVVLGSATPSLESYSNAQRGRYASLSLPNRVQSRPLPAVEVIDLAHAPRVEGASYFSQRLVDAVRATLAQDEQAIVFLNRRGFAPYVSCRDCGYAYRCDACDVSLTLHRKRHVLLCHYCGYEERPPEECKGCHGHRLDSGGLGTERVELELRAAFGDVGISRLDRDTVRGRRDLERELERFRTGHTRLLVGTQMVAKGHDFPNVTLVGVLLADGSLNFPDFRAAERTFQLLTQVAGRAGRGVKPGRVLVQTYAPTHYAIVHASRHDFAGFAAEELRERQELGYPPFGHVVLLRAESQSEAGSVGAAALVAEAVRANVERAGSAVQVLGPAAAPLAKLKMWWRTQVMVRGADRQAVRRAIAELPKLPANTRLIVDVDPVNML